MLVIRNVTDEKHSPPYRGADAPLEGFLFGPMLRKRGKLCAFVVNFGRGMLAIRDGTNETYSPPSHFLKDFKPWRKARRIMQSAKFRVLQMFVFFVTFAFSRSVPNPEL